MLQGTDRVLRNTAHGTDAERYLRLADQISAGIHALGPASAGLLDGDLTGPGTENDLGNRLNVATELAAAVELTLRAWATPISGPAAEASVTLRDIEERVLQAFDTDASMVRP